MQREGWSEGVRGSIGEKEEEPWKEVEEGEGEEQQLYIGCKVSLQGERGTQAAGREWNKFISLRTMNVTFDKVIG